MASARASLMNRPMQAEREQALQAESHQRTVDRQGYAMRRTPFVGPSARGHAPRQLALWSREQVARALSD
jgi:hypothetical protein